MVWVNSTGRPFESSGAIQAGLWTRERLPRPQDTIPGHSGAWEHAVGANSFEKYDFWPKLVWPPAEDPRTASKTLQNFYGALASVAMSPLLQGQARVGGFLLLHSNLVAGFWLFFGGNLSNLKHIVQLYF